MNEGTGLEVFNLSGRSGSNTIDGALWTSGKDGYALNFNGINGYIDCGTDIAPTEISIVTKINTSNRNKNFQMIATKDDTGTTSSAWDFRFWSTTGTIEFERTQGGSYRTGLRTTTVLSNDTDYTLGVSCKSGDNRIFTNGVEEDSDTFTGDILSDTQEVNIGARQSGAAFNYVGKIYYVYIYNRALSPTEMLDITRNPYQIFQLQSMVELFGEVPLVTGPKSPDQVTQFNLMGLFGPIRTFTDKGEVVIVVGPPERRQYFRIKRTSKGMWREYFIVEE